MSADFRKVRPGQPLRITAKAWNRVLDSVSTRPEFAGSEGVYSRPCHVVQIKNTTGSTVPKWGVLGITGIVNDPTAGAASLAQFQDVPILEGSVPQDATASKFAVAVEPIAAGKIGRAAVDGVVQVKLNVIDVGHQFAKTSTSTAGLDTAGSGEASILWRETGTGTNKWGLVRIGGGPGGTRVGKITSSWGKNETQTVQEYSDAGVSLETTFEAINRFADLSASSSAPKWVACALIGSKWHLIAAEC